MMVRLVFEIISDKVEKSILENLIFSRCVSGAVPLGGQGGHLPTQFFRNEKAKNM